MANGSAGAPEGNSNSSKDNRLWRNTIMRAIAQSDPEKLRKVADKLIEKAAEGDLAAIKELGDRIDGKATQQLQVGGEGGGPIVVEIRRYGADQPPE